MSSRLKELRKRDKLQRRLRNGFLRNRNEVLRCKVKQLQRKLDQTRRAHTQGQANEELHEKLRVLEKEVAVLKCRPALFDPLRDPVHRLPAELQSIIQTEAVRCDKTLSNEDVRALLMLEPPPFPNNIQVPIELRPQYVKLLLQTNVVEVDSLRWRENAIAKYEAMTGINVWTSIRSLHLELYGSFLRHGNIETCAEYIGEQQAIVKKCANTQHFALVLKIDPWYCEPGDNDLLKSSGYQEALQAMTELKTMHIKLSKKDQSTRVFSEAEIELANNWGRDMVKKIREAIMQVAPDCQITDSPEIDWNGGNN